VTYKTYIDLSIWSSDEKKMQLWKNYLAAGLPKLLSRFCKVFQIEE